MNIIKDKPANVTVLSLLLVMPIHSRFHTKWVAIELFDICSGVLFCCVFFTNVVNIHIKVESIPINYYII